MARVTVEDCVIRIPNRFDLVMIAAQRSRDVSAGAPVTIDPDNDKNPVIALREIADETVQIDNIQESLVRGLQRHVEIDTPEDEETDLSAGENAIRSVDPNAIADSRMHPQYDDAMAQRMGMQIHGGQAGFQDADEADLAAEK